MPKRFALTTGAILYFAVLGACDANKEPPATASSEPAASSSAPIQSAAPGTSNTGVASESPAGGVSLEGASSDSRTTDPPSLETSSSSNSAPTSEASASASGAEIPAPGTDMTAAMGSTLSDAGIVGIGGLANFVCPPAPYATAPVATEATAQRLVEVPEDEFAEASDTIVFEGPVWFEGALYISQINTGGPAFGAGPGMGGGMPPGSAAADAGMPANREPPPSRILRVDETGNLSVALADSGTNGLALDTNGILAGCNHKTGSIAQLPVGAEAAAEIVSSYDGSRFNSPNDLTFGADGTLYFTDPDYQAPSPAPQIETRAYRVPAGTSMAIPFTEGAREPNGITLSPSGTTLYMSTSEGLFSYPVLLDGSLGSGTPFAQGVVQSSDGMAVDCAGNLYTTANQTVLIVDPSGVEIGRITVPGVQSVTNVAFGGADQRTIFITALGSGTRSGIFYVAGDVPGMPY